MAQGKAGQGIDKWLASLGKSEKAKPRVRKLGEWTEEDAQAQRDLQTKDEVQDFFRHLMQRGEVKSRPDLAGRSVEDNNEKTGVRGAPAVRGPMQRVIPGVKSVGQPNDRSPRLGGPGEELMKLLAFLDDKLTTRPTVGRDHLSELPSQTGKYKSLKPSHELRRQVDQNYQTRALKKAGKPGKPLNKGLF